MSALDIGIFVVITLCSWIGFRNGLIRTIFRFVSFFLAIFLASQLYPYVARFLRDTVVFEGIRNSISSGLNLEVLVRDHFVARQSELIDALPLPAVIRQLLHDNNTPNMYELLQVYTIEDYISSFFATIAINGIAMVTVFLIIFIGFCIAGVLLDVVDRLPIIGTLNGLGGLVIGILIGAVVVWVALTVLTMVFAMSGNQAIGDLLDASVAATWLMDRGIVLQNLIRI